LSAQASAQQQFTESQLKEDFLFYTKKLEQYHPNLYLYTAKERVDQSFGLLQSSVSQQSSEAEFYQKIAHTSEIIKDGHTLILPSNDFIDYHNSQSKFLPIQIGISNQKLYVKMDCSSTKRFEEGTVIDSINGMASSAIIQRLLERQVRDGENISYATWILDAYFREYYSYLFEHPETYQIAYKKGTGSFKVQIPALKKDSIYYYRAQRYPNFQSGSKEGKGVYLQYNDSKNVAILTIKDFHTDVLKHQYKQKFTSEIKKIFTEISQNQTQNLIIDLRDNQGGDVENGVALLKYLIAKPFKVVNEYYKLKNGTLVKTRGPSMGYHKPHSKHFNGQIYVLINGGSFSNTVIVSSCLRENTNAVFVGTESGGNPHVLAGYTKDLMLPNTKIRVQIPTKRFVMTSMEENNGSGLIPDHKIEQSIQDIIQHQDRQLESILNLIQEKENRK
jgi:hypothetical protein